MLSKADSAKLVEANTRISLALEGIRDNLKLINDQNILHIEILKNHASKCETQCVETRGMFKVITEKLQDLTARYWYLIIGLISALLLVSGYKEAIKIFIPGG